MPELDELMGELRAAGELDSVGRFTLDRHRAREKMRHFQLADPRAYVLELVQAAVLAGATEARFEIDADDMHLAFDGRPFTAQDFEELYSSMFARRQTAGAQRQLALGLNAAMALDPRHLHVESGEAGMEMRAGTDDAISAARQPVDGTRIHLRHRFSKQTVLRFLRKLRGNLAEIVYLRERCRYARLPIYLNGRRISGEAPLADVLGRIETRGIVAGFSETRRTASLMIVKDGVWITDHELEGFPDHFAASVESRELHKDVSQRDVVRDAAYEHLLAALPAALHLALANLAELVDSRPERQALFRRAFFLPLSLPLARRQLAAVRAAKDPPHAAAAAVPLWASARNPRIALSLVDLYRLRAAHEKLSWSWSRHPELMRQDEPPIAVISLERERTYFKELFGDSFYCAETTLQNEKKRARNVERWLQRRMSPKIPAPSGSLVSVPLATAEVSGEVGIFHDPLRHSEGHEEFSAWLITQGRLLEKRTAVPVIPGLAAALEADFRPSRVYDQVNIDPLYVRVAIAVARALAPLMNELAAKILRHSVPVQRFSALCRRCVIPYLGLDWQGDGLERFLASFGISGKKHLALARRCDQEEPIAAISTVADLRGKDPPPLARLPLFATLHGRPLSLIDLAARSADPSADPWLYLPRDHPSGPDVEEDVLLLDEAELAALRWIFKDQQEVLPVFADLGGRPVDLRTIREALGRDGQLDYRPADHSDRDEVELAGDRFVLRLSHDDHRALAAIFGSETLVDAGVWLEARRQAREISSAEPLESLELPALDVLVTTAVADLRGEVGLRSEPGKGGLELRLCKGGRLYATWETAATYALVALVEDQALELDGDGLLDLSGPRPAELAELCLAQVPALIAKLIADEGLWRGASRHAARCHLIDHLVASAAFENHDDGQPVYNLPAFDGVTGPCSFVDLCRSYALFNLQAYLPRSQRRGGQPLDPRRCVLLASPPEVARLERLFPRLENYENQWAEEQRLRWRLEDAPALVAEPPARPLVSRRARGRGGLRAHLWLPAEPGAELLCAFGFAGRLLACESLSDLLPCAGVVTGEGLVAAAGRLTPSQRQGLERSAFRLYRQLAKNLGSPRRAHGLDGERMSAARRLLRRVRGALFKRFAKADHGLDDDYVELLHQLEEMELSDRQAEVADPVVRTAAPESPEARLLGALTAELAWVHERHADLLDEKNLDRIVLADLDRDVIARCQSHGVAVNRRQPLVRRLLEGSETDPVLMAFLASAVYSAMNDFWQEIEDDHEREFHRELVDALLDRLAADRLPG